VIRLVLILCVFIFSCSVQRSEQFLLNKKNPNGIYGSKITLQEHSKHKNLIGDPDRYIGKDVLFTGEIVEVCPMRGCWINVKDNNSDEIIRVKVKDGVIVFPISSKGKQVDVQGEFSQLIFSDEQAKNWKIHLAEEKGIVLNPEDIILEDSDFVEYRIIGEGAIIYDYGCN
tara:strand:+ start:2986 stop:3498 length:513 start_codon:yes stop_codon:yes gene_type:complete